jgi:hypothetical protein
MSSYLECTIILIILVLSLLQFVEFVGLLELLGSNLVRGWRLEGKGSRVKARGWRQCKTSAAVMLCCSAGVFEVT